MRYLQSLRLLSWYADGLGILPDGLSLKAVGSQDYTRRLVANQVAIKYRYRTLTERAKVALVALIHWRVTQNRFSIPIPSARILEHLFVHMRAKSTLFC